MESIIQPPVIHSSFKNSFFETHFHNYLTDFTDPENLLALNASYTLGSIYTLTELTLKIFKDLSQNENKIFNNILETIDNGYHIQQQEPLFVLGGVSILIRQLFYN